MRNLRFVFLASILFSLAPSFAAAQAMITVNEMDGTYGQYSDMFVVKLTVDGNNSPADATYRGYALTSGLGHAPIYWQFPVPTNAGEVMVTANAIPGYQIGGPVFVPYDPAGGFCYITFDPSIKLQVFLIVTEDASGAHCSIS